MVAALASLLVSMGGCDAGSDGGPDDSATGGGPPTTNEPPPSISQVLVTVQVQDAFGAPVPGAQIKLLRSDGTGVSGSAYLADQDGRAEIATDSLTHGVLVSAPDMESAVYESTRQADDHLEITVTLHPSSEPAGGVGAMSVISGSRDGRELAVSARLYIVDGNDTQVPGDWRVNNVRVPPCEPDVDSDAMIFEADCVEGPPGFDASYQGSTTTVRTVHPEPGTAPLALAVLLDQGASVAATDPGDRRLLAAKYLQTRVDADDRVAIAAFASDSTSTGEKSLLPVQPVTIYPVEDPGFTSDGRAWFPTIDALASLEGGASPLHVAAGELIAFTTSSAPADSQPNIVALVSGTVDGCGGPAACRAAQTALLGESASAGVPIIAVGLPDPSGQVDGKRLGMFAQSVQGAVFWAHEAAQVATIFGRLPAILHGLEPAVDVNARLESSVPGTFAPGNLVVGTFTLEVCPSLCDDFLAAGYWTVEIPFAIRIP